MIKQGNNNWRKKNGSGEERENQSFHVKHSAKNKLQTVCGMRPVMEAIDSGSQIDKIFVQSNLEGKLSQELMSVFPLL